MLLEIVLQGQFRTTIDGLRDNWTPGKYENVWFKVGIDHNVHKYEHILNPCFSMKNFFTGNDHGAFASRTPLNVSIKLFYLCADFFKDYNRARNQGKIKQL